MLLVSETQTAQVNLTLGLEEKLNKLHAIMHECDSVLVAYSGGVDRAGDGGGPYTELGERALACIGVSPSYPKKREIRDAVKLAQADWRSLSSSQHGGIPGCRLYCPTPPTAVTSVNRSCTIN